MKRLVGLCLLMIVWLFPLASLQAQADCSTAPIPRLTLEGGARVVPGDANNVRDLPAKSGTKTGSIPGGAIFDVLEGPTCADGLNWWKVQYEDLIGWTVEGADGEYWVEPYEEVVIEYPPADPYDLGLPIMNTPQIGAEARVWLEEGTLRMREEPLLDAAIVRSAENGEIVTIIDGSTESQGFIWWKVRSADGKEGWVIEGYLQKNFDRDRDIYLPALIPVCPFTENRIGFIRDYALYTADHDGGEICQLARLKGSLGHTFWGYVVYAPNTIFWSPDGQTLAFVSVVDHHYELFTVSIDGSTIRRLTPSNEVLWLAWSPDSKRLALSRIIEGQSTAQIWVINADGSNPVRISSENTFKPWVTWIDNERLIYMEQIGDQPTQMGGPDEFNFYVVGANLSSPQAPFTANIGIHDKFVSSDGRYFAYNGFGKDEYGSPELAQTVIRDLETGETVFDVETYLRIIWMRDSSGFYVIDGEHLSKYTLKPFSSETFDLENGHPMSYVSGWFDDTHLLGYTKNVLYLIDVENLTVSDAGFGFKSGILDFNGLLNTEVQPNQ